MTAVKVFNQILITRVVFEFEFTVHQQLEIGPQTVTKFVIFGYLQFIFITLSKDSSFEADSSKLGLGSFRVLLVLQYAP